MVDASPCAAPRARKKAGRVTPEAVVAILGAVRFPLAREKETQAAIAAALAQRAVPFEREVDLGRRNIVDFVVAGETGIEVKVGGSKRDIFEQCRRYCRSGRLSALILATNVAIGFPPDVEGVPCFVVSLGRGWL